MKKVRNIIAGILLVIIILTFNYWIWIIAILSFTIYEIDRNMMLKEIRRKPQESEKDTK